MKAVVRVAVDDVPEDLNLKGLNAHLRLSDEEQLVTLAGTCVGVEYPTPPDPGETGT